MTCERRSVSIAQRVHAALAPVFVELSPMAYQDDFIKHDAQALREHAVPGAVLWWIASRAGTSLLWLGVERETAQSVLKMHHAPRCFRVDVGTLTDRLVELSGDELVEDVARRQEQPSVADASVWRERVGGDIFVRVVSRGVASELMTMTATPVAASIAGNAKTFAVHARSSRPDLPRFTLVQALARAECALRSWLGTNDWQVTSESTIDGVPRQAWIDATLVGSTGLEALRRPTPTRPNKPADAASRARQASHQH